MIKKAKPNLQQEKKISSSIKFVFWLGFNARRTRTVKQADNDEESVRLRSHTTAYWWWKCLEIKTSSKFEFLQQNLFLITVNKYCYCQDYSKSIQPSAFMSATAMFVDFIFKLVPNHVSLVRHCYCYIFYPAGCFFKIYLWCIIY